MKKEMRIERKSMTDQLLGYPAAIHFSTAVKSQEERALVFFGIGENPAVC